MSTVPAPLFRDPIYDGAADPMIIRNHDDGFLYMFYTQRRANQQVDGVSFCYGCNIGVAISENGGSKWYYRGALDLNYEFGQNTFWAPEIIFDEANGKYHMFVSYIRGVYFTWEGKATLQHYVSDDLLYWVHIGGLSFSSSRIIDPCLFTLPDGTYRMWYKDENRNQHTCCANSKDLYEWEFGGEVIADCEHEGPNVFALGDNYWMIVDTWDGQGVYRSHDLEHFTKQSENILREGGTRKFDNTKGLHADVFESHGKAYIVYFTHPFMEMPDYCHSMIQIAELRIADGRLACDRNAEFEINL